MTEITPIRIRPATDADAEAIARIYNHYITHTVVTFEVDQVTRDEMVRRIDKVRTESLPWLVVALDDVVAGYSYATRWHTRHAYRFSAETSVYLSPDHGGRGIGTRLYQELLDLLMQKGVHTVIGGIALPNDASVALHEKFGYQKAAHYREVGFKFDRWIDVGYWQRIFS